MIISFKVCFVAQSIVDNTNLLFQCYTSEYFVENTTFDSNVTVANCTEKKKYCLTQKYVSLLKFYANFIKIKKIIFIFKRDQ